MVPSLHHIDHEASDVKIIHQKCPSAKILFVTQDRDDDVRNAAMQAGAVDYLLKANAGNKLLDAITAALYR